MAILKQRMRRHLFFPVFLVTLLVGCDSSSEDSNSSESDTSVSGSYSLVYLNGNALPAQVGSGDHIMTVISGSLELSSDGNYRLVYSFSFFGHNDTSDESGTWFYNNDRMTMTHPERGIQYPDNSVVEGQSVTLHSTFNGPDSLPFILHFEK